MEQPKSPSSSGINCSLCKDKIFDKNIAILYCGHKFHFSCARNKIIHNKCPLCKTNIITGVTLEEEKRRRKKREDEIRERKKEEEEKERWFKDYIKSQEETREYSRSQTDRQNKGLEGQKFEEWKKQKKDDERAAEEEGKKKEKEEREKKSQEREKKSNKTRKSPYTLSPASPVPEKPDPNCPSKGKKPKTCQTRKEYKEQALIFHPDRNIDCKEKAKVKFQELRILCDKN